MKNKDKDLTIKPSQIFMCGPQENRFLEFIKTVFSTSLIAIWFATGIIVCEHRSEIKQHAMFIQVQNAAENIAKKMETISESFAGIFEVESNLEETPKDNPHHNKS